MVINLVVITVCTNVTYIDHLYFEFHNSYESIIVTFDVEYKMLVPNSIYSPKGFFDICERIPFGIFSFLEPFFQCSFGISVFGIKQYQCPMGDYPHCFLV